MTRPVRFLSLACLSLLLLFLGTQPASAGFREFVAGLAQRERVIQICVVVACLALFILLKKFSFGMMKDEG